ncbi:MAG TPA: alkaline phosphatase family protein [Chloroflexota bacterium]|jgi:phospholipase C
MRLPTTLGTALLTCSLVGAVASDTQAQDQPQDFRARATAVRHLVVIFQENVSFDHYFATYPNAANPAGEPRFTADADTPSVNGLTLQLLRFNPNLGNPQRLDRSEALTCDQDHDYTPEQNAADHGAMDAFVQNTSDTAGGKPVTRGQCDIPTRSSPANDFAVMDYYDGNTVTGLWNYAQHFAMSDNSYGTTYGPSTPGALNVTAGNTFPTLCAADRGAALSGGDDPDVYDAANNVKPCPGGLSTKAPAGSTVGTGTGTMVGDADPYFDACADGTASAAQGGRTIGDLLNDRGVTWGWFEGGFSSPNYIPGQKATFDPSTICTGHHYNIGAGPDKAGKPCVTPSAPPQPIDTFCTLDYSPHHEPFQYFASTSNPQHLPPTTIDNIGKQDQANHQYDLADFWAAVDRGNMPAVSYLKAERAEDGHAHNSSPLDEQRFLVSTINHLERSSDWDSTMVAILWDDSDGWYDHVLAPLTTQSQTGLDSLTGAGQCGATTTQVPSGQEARCGLGPRLPLLIVSPFAKQNFVDHAVTDQSSVIRFIEDNWNLGRIGNGSSDATAGSLTNMLDLGGHRADRLFLDPATGERR